MKVYNFILTEKNMSFPYDDSLTYIKQELPKDQNFSERFVSVIENLEAKSVVSKDSIFQWLKLFDQNYEFFADLFETSFLLIFKSYTDFSSTIERRPAQQVVKGYAELLETFLGYILDLQLEVKLSQEKKESVQKFINFELQFFSQGLTAGKSFIKEFSFQMIISTLKVVSEKLDFHPEPTTQAHLLESTLYLLASKPQDNKKMGIQLYGNLTKMGIKSSEIRQLSMQYLEQVQNYAIRQSLIRQAISLEKQDSWDRFLNRLKDKNPLIAEEVIQKLIDEGIAVSDLKFEQRIKLIVDGWGSFHQKIRQKAFEYFKNELLEIFNQDQDEQIEKKNEEKEVKLKTLNKSFSRSINRSRIIFETEENKVLSRVQKLVRIFNYDQYENLGSDIFRENPFASSLICPLICSFVMQTVPFEQIVVELRKIFTKIQLYSLQSQDCVFTYSLLRVFHQSNMREDQRSLIQVRRKLKQFISESEEIPQIQVFISYFRKLSEEKNNSSLTTKFYLLKIIEILSVHLEIYDCVGKRIIYNELIKILRDFNFSEGFFNENPVQSKSLPTKAKENVIYLQLTKASHLMNTHMQKDSEKYRPKLELVTGQMDLILCVTQIIHKILTSEPSCEKGELKLLVSELIESKNLKIEKETIMNMRIKTANELQMMTETDSGKLDNRSCSHLMELSKEIQRKLQMNQKNIVSRTLKAFYILIKMLWIKQNQKSKKHSYLNDFSASNYYQAVKIYIYEMADNVKFSAHGQLQTCWIPYMLFYHITCESVENFTAFKNLFDYYAFGQESSLCEKDCLLKLISSRMLLELECRHNSSEALLRSSEEKDVSVLQKILGNLMNNNLNDPRQSHFFQQVILRLLSAVPSSQETDSIFCNLLIFAVRQFMNDEHDGIFSRAFVLVFRSMSLNNLERSFKSIMLYQLVLANLINEQKAVLLKEDKQLLFWHASKIIKGFLAFIQLQEGHLSEKEKVKRDLLELSLSLKAYEFGPQIMFLPLASVETLQNISCQNIEDMQIEVLIFVKSQLEKFIQKFKLRQFSAYQSIQKDLKTLLYWLETIQEKIGYVIMKTLKSEEADSFEKQSTDHSPQDNSAKPTHLKSNTINFDRIDMHRAQLKDQILTLNSIAHKISQSLFKTNTFKSLCKDFVLFVAKYKANYSETSAGKDQIKVEEDNLHQTEKKNQQLSKVNPITVEFDRNGRRKLTDLERLKKQNIVKASVKKSRYIIIPYDLVENAEEKYGRKSHKKSIKGSVKHSNDKSFKPSFRTPSSYSQLQSNQQLSSQQESNPFDGPETF